ncbi:inositol monophosphatase family protein [Pseudonocardia spinosispora]|uniref:inositol monophosphatase family protein n=1 Tax=Pseudonocardia spinosispora TaxID=103441 RepID=UPI00040EC33B|nr:inositol monophosphatase family protein [Pseudonocardia spinosispora]
MNSDRPDLDNLRAVAVQVAGEAAELASSKQAVAGDEVRTKSSRTDVVTAVDTAVEELLRRRLAELRPSDAVLGEEAGLSAADSWAGDDGQLRWVVDPIDGTVNFLYGIPWYAVSVAVVRGDEVLAGAVVEPASGRVWSASLGGGATVDGRPLGVSGADELALALVSTGFSYQAERRSRQGALAASLLSEVRDIRRFGSAALDLCAVAAGWCDGYYEHAINQWDWAAGALIAREAGAVVQTPDPEAPFGNAIVAATPGIVVPLTEALVALGAARV